MAASKKVQIHFSDIFRVPRAELDHFGAFDVSLVNDLPLFVDPFLLFASTSPEYQKLHRDIIKYLAFLRDKALSGPVSRGLSLEWFHFKEVPNNWLGFSMVGNSGHGLGGKFARSLERNLRTVFATLGSEEIARSSHLEKLGLIDPGVGRDTISDFTVNLIKEYLLEFTQDFASQFIGGKRTRHLRIERVRFDYATESWVPGDFVLPVFCDEYVLLTPKRILTRDRGWISRPDLLGSLEVVIEAVEDDQLRSKLNNFLLRELPINATQEDRSTLLTRMARQFPEILEWFIRLRENNAEGAFRRSEKFVADSELLFVQHVKELSNLLLETPFYNLKPDTYADALSRGLFLKDVIENKGGWRSLYVDGEPIRKEEDVHVFYRLTWYGTVHDVSREVDDGRGPADFKVSSGAEDKTIIEFKLARNTRLAQNLERQAEVYKSASDADRALNVIVFFTEQEEKKVKGVIEDLGLEGDPNIILIDARDDNKPSGSRA